MKYHNNEAKEFFQYALWIPILLTLFLEILKVEGALEDASWFWVVSPIWIWALGSLQLLLGGMLMAIFKGDYK